MGKVTRYEVVNPHYCTECGRMVAQTTLTRAWIARSFQACNQCDTIAAELLTNAYRDGLNVIYLEGSNQ